jgi:glycosyltransferase involved in cell wall biosynthesis
MLGPVRYADTGKLFDRARIFLNTSSIEGFPNTFLQAWIRAVPVVSFFDPDGLVNRLQLGRIASSLDDMREAIRGLLDVHTYRENIGQRAREFAVREFTSGVAARYIERLEDSSEGLRAANGGTVP